MFGKSIKIYLSDGSPSGLRHVEIANWSGQAIACPRRRLSELKNWNEAKCPGVYFLLEKHSTDGRNSVYIGESENVYKRLSEHDRNKDFWNEVIIFSSKDENLTKSHVKFLESRLTEMAKIADIYSIENSNNPTLSTLPRSDKDAMEEFIHNTKIVLGTLGHKFLNPLEIKEPKETETNINSSVNELLFFKVRGLIAKGKVSDDGFILIRGSEISKKTTTSLTEKIKLFREKLITDEILIVDDNKFILTKEIVLSSSSFAAAFVAGTARSGPEGWKNSNGTSLKALEEKLIEY